ncbi:MAG TPA: hypothetical protein VEO19_07600 [Terriglobia bacterium]|nr:hypothetical protein [Terriglobia bacterium]
MVLKAFLCALLFVAILNVVNLRAQDNGCTRRTIPVGVVDSAWNLVPNLSAANFRGKVGRQDVQVLSAVLDESPRRIVVLLDASGSTMDPIAGGGWKEEKTMAESLIRFAPPRASIAFLGFSRTILDTEGFAEGPLALLKNLLVLLKVCEQPRKGRKTTALYDSIASARDLLKAPKRGDVICALTDGGDNVSRTTPRRVREELLRAGVRLFAGLIIAPELRSRPQTPEEIVGSNEIRNLAEVTGGNTLAVPMGLLSEPDTNIRANSRAESVYLDLQRLFLQMGVFYRLDVRLPEMVEKPTKWKLEAADASGKPMRRVEVHYPQELMPCTDAGP